MREAGRAVLVDGACVGGRGAPRGEDPSEEVGPSGVGLEADECTTLRLQARLDVRCDRVDGVGGREALGRRQRAQGGRDDVEADVGARGLEGEHERARRLPHAPRGVRGEREIVRHALRTHSCTRRRKASGAAARRRGGRGVWRVRGGVRVGGACGVHALLGVLSRAVAHLEHVCLAAALDGLVARVEGRVQLVRLEEIGRTRRVGGGERGGVAHEEDGALVPRAEQLVSAHREGVRVVGAAQVVAVRRRKQRAAAPRRIDVKPEALRRADRRQLVQRVEGTACARVRTLSARRARRRLLHHQHCGRGRARRAGRASGGRAGRAA
eukprot:6656503-Prymnesium_polylepis.1